MWKTDIKNFLSRPYQFIAILLKVVKWSSLTESLELEFNPRYVYTTSCKLQCSVCENVMNAVMPLQTDGKKSGPK